MVKKHKTPNAEAQALWRERHVKGKDGEKERLTLVLDAGTKARLKRIAKHYGYKSITDLLEQWSESTDSEVSEEIAQREKSEAIKKLHA